MATTVNQIRNRTVRQSLAADRGIENFILSLHRFLGSNLDDVLQKVLEGKVSGVESASILGNLLTELENRGLTAEVGKIRAIYADELRFISDEFEEQGLTGTFSHLDKDSVDALINIQTSQTLNRVEKYGIDVSAQVMRQVIGGETPDIKQITKSLTPGLEGQLTTEIGTAVMAFNRSVTLQKAAELNLHLFLYVGPDDKVTRPFCHKLLERSPAIYTRDEISAMDNGSDLSVYAYGGGYNCRHHWRALTEELAKELGYAG